MMKNLTKNYFFEIYGDARDKKKGGKDILHTYWKNSSNLQKNP
jgi:hypothetical protein